MYESIDRSLIACGFIQIECFFTGKKWTPEGWEVDTLMKAKGRESRLVCLPCWLHQIFLHADASDSGGVAMGLDWTTSDPGGYGRAEATNFLHFLSAIT